MGKVTEFIFGPVADIARGPEAIHTTIYDTLVGFIYLT
jgi:hypothetical protein